MLDVERIGKNCFWLLWSAKQSFVCVGDEALLTARNHISVQSLAAAWPYDRRTTAHSKCSVIYS